MAYVLSQMCEIKDLTWFSFLKHFCFKTTSSRILMGSTLEFSSDQAVLGILVKEFGIDVLFLFLEKELKIISSLGRI